MIERTSYNTELSLNDTDRHVVLNGWVHHKRNFGARNFIDLRDRTGLIQCVFDETFSEQLKEIKPEYLLQVQGIVRPRKQVNPKLETGEIEVIADSVEIINPSAVPPIVVEDESEALEETRLHYRYLDLRRPVMTKNLILRHQITRTLREFLDRHGFIEIETPFLGKSTPEGARDYLVPARNYPGSFFALPQSPQLYKQLLMISGFDRYYQIVRCFRDEDLRADRQSEFTQLDMEMSFLSQEQIMAMQEEMMKDLFAKVLDIDIPTPFPVLTFENAMNTYGSDKPDLRYGFELRDVTSLFEKTDFTPFMDESKTKVIKGILDSAAALNNKKIKAYEELAKKNGAARIITLKYDGQWKGSAVKNFSQKELEGLTEMFKPGPGDILFLVQAAWAKCCQALGAIREQIAKEKGLIHPGEFAFCWVVDFPLFEYSENEGRYVSQHHPFTLPKMEDLDLLDSHPEQVKTAAYDICCNGYELGGGSLRIYDNKLQQKIFTLLGLSQKEIEEKFGFFIDAFQYGTPPHGGLAYGLDRLVMIMAGVDSIKEVIAFPKSASARDPLTNAPSAVDSLQLEELHLKIDEN